MNDINFIGVEEKVIKDIFELFVSNNLNIRQCKEILSCVEEDLEINTRIMMPE